MTATTHRRARLALLLAVLMAAQEASAASAGAAAAEPARRPRAGAFRLRKTPPAAPGAASLGGQPGPDLKVECAMRRVAFDMAMRKLRAR